MKYILLTYDAIKEFASGRFYQSEEYKDSIILCAVLRGEDKTWSHSKIQVKYTENGLIFYTSDIDRNNGILFDLSTFSGFSNSNEKIITIFQKVLKYAVRYFENYPLVNCEHAVAHTNLTIVYPFPFVAVKDVDKIYIDRNSGKLDRKGQNFLTVFFFGNDDKRKVVYTNLKKAIAELRDLRCEVVNEQRKRGEELNNPLIVTDLTDLSLPIDSPIGIDNWTYYLTEKQKSFVNRECNGAERLEGAAGTGKTLSMVLRCINVLRKHIENNTEYHIVFITHSIATKERIESIFESNWSDYKNYKETSNNRPYISVFVTTLQEWSANNLGTNSIDDDQYLDKDASSSKELQRYYIEEAFGNVYKEYWSVFELICSKEFKAFMKGISHENLISTLQMEVAIIIKGHNIFDLDEYKDLERPTYSMPLVNDADKTFVYNVYKKYQEALTNVDQYDSDDIVMTALGNIVTPIWNRKRAKLGYDECYIDETHLFNINELSLLHFINKPAFKDHIIFAIDKSQAVGDWGLTDTVINDKLGLQQDKPVESHKFRTVFRSSPSIVNLAFNVLTSAANIFTNFDNPLDYSSYNLTLEEERKCLDPQYTLCNGDDEMILSAIAKAEGYCRQYNLNRSSVLLAASSASLLCAFEKILKDSHKQFVTLESRSDSKTIKDAIDNNKFVLGHIDYIGGLEFDCMIMIGIDEGRVPPSKEGSPDHFINYAWYNRIYVAITRAKYIVHIFGDVNRGASALFDTSIKSGSIKLT